MSRGAQLFVSVGCLLALSCTYAERHETATTGAEIIVKFAADRAINETIVRAFDDAEAQTLIKESVQALSSEIGVPLVYSRLTSGREIIVEIPVKQTYEVLAERIRRAESVENVAIRQRASGNVSNGADEILVTVDNSKVKLGPGADLDATAARLVADGRFRLICRLRAEDQLGITPDFEHLVGTLAKELASRPDIEYAQPNYRVRHYSRTE